MSCRGAPATRHFKLTLPQLFDNNKHIECLSRQDSSVCLLYFGRDIAFNHLLMFEISCSVFSLGIALAIHHSGSIFNCGYTSSTMCQSPFVSWLGG